VATLIVMGLYAIGIIFFNTRIGVLGLLGAALCVLTVLGTSMIYTQIKTVPRWHHWTTPLVFLSYALTGGAFLTGEVQIAAAGLVTIGILQIIAWVIGDKRFAASGSTIETATGLGTIGKTRMFEAPHSSKNYLMKEMVPLAVLRRGRTHRRALLWATRLDPSHCRSTRPPRQQCESFRWPAHKSGPHRLSACPKSGRAPVGRLQTRPASPAPQAQP